MLECSRYPNDQDLKKDDNSITITASDEVLTDEEFEKCFQRAYYLEHKQYTTIEEDRELELFKSQQTCFHATRMAELEFKENKTAQEQHELDLLSDPQTRPITKRILELEGKQRSKYEELELKYLLNPITRPHTKQVMYLLHKPYLSHSDKRKAFIYNNLYSIKKSEEIIDLESHYELSKDNIETLSNDYLLKISKVDPQSNVDFDKFKDNQTKYNTGFKNQYTSPLTADEVRVAAIKNAFNTAAQTLVMGSLKASMRGNQSLLARASLFSPMQNLIQSRQAALALVLEKYFFDYNIEFSAYALNLITNHLKDLIDNQKLSIKDYNPHLLQNIIYQKINEKDWSAVQKEESEKNKHKPW